MELTSKDEESADRLDNGVGLTAASGTQVNTSDEEGHQQSDDSEGKQSLASLEPIWNKKEPNG